MVTPVRVEDGLRVSPLKFVWLVEVPGAEEAALLRALRGAFPELVWREGEGNFGKMYVAGESGETPARVGVHLLCKEPPGPLTLTIRLDPVEGAAALAEALRSRVMGALPGSKATAG